MPLARRARAGRNGSESHEQGERKGRYRHVKTKRGGTGVRASDWLIVPMKVGNRDPAGPSGGKGPASL